MKRILTFLFVINLTISCVQSKQISVTGKWKIISVNTEDVYFNTKIDSISISKKFKKMFADSLELNNVIKVMKMTYNNNVMEFRDNGVYTQKINSKLKMNGTYRISPLDREIIIRLKDEVNWKMNYEIKSGFLHLTSTLYDKKTEFFLKRIEK